MNHLNVSHGYDFWSRSYDCDENFLVHFESPLDVMAPTFPGLSAFIERLESKMPTAKAKTNKDLLLAFKSPAPSASSKPERFVNQIETQDFK